MFLAGRNSATREDVKSAADELGTHEATAAGAKPVAAAPAARAAGGRGGAAPRRQPTDLDSVFDAPPAPSRGPARAHADMDEVVASATPQPRARAKAPPMPAGRGAPDKTMILSAGEDFDMEEDGFEMRPAPSSGPPKEEEIDDLFAEIVEES